MPTTAQSNQTRLLGLTLALVFAGSLIASFFFKERWLWMDEVLSYLLIADPSPAHANRALVSGMDANPPLFANAYWLIGHGLSLHPLFLRGVSVVIFAGTAALFYGYVTRLVGTPRTNFVLITAIFAFTYLNLSLATQIRTYALFLFVSLGFFVSLHWLSLAPRSDWGLGLLLLTGLGMVMTHNFGLFYLAASGAFFGLLWLWSRKADFWRVLAVHAGILALWGLLWYPSFAVQAEAGKPHSWIPLPTFGSFFRTVGELAPTLSSGLEQRFRFLPVLRFGLVAGLYGFIALPRLRRGFRVVQTDGPFLFFLLAGFLWLTTMAIALGVSLAHTSVFLSRYLWPSHLLVVYLLVYGFYHFFGKFGLPRLRPLLPLYVAGLAAFLFYQNRKVAIFPSDILAYLPQLDARVPVFVETADYFLPIWLQNRKIPVRYVLNWETASHKGNLLSATVQHRILEAVKRKYGVGEIVDVADFNAESYPHFYVVDESSVYQAEDFLLKNKIEVIRTIPVGVAGHRILECHF